MVGGAFYLQSAHQPASTSCSFIPLYVSTESNLARVARELRDFSQCSGWINFLSSLHNSSPACSFEVNNQWVGHHEYVDTMPITATHGNMVKTKTISLV